MKAGIRLKWCWTAYVGKLETRALSHSVPQRVLLQFFVADAVKVSVTVLFLFQPAERSSWCCHWVSNSFCHCMSSVKRYSDKDSWTSVHKHWSLFDYWLLSVPSSVQYWMRIHGTELEGTDVSSEERSEIMIKRQRLRFLLFSFFFLFLVKFGKQTINKHKQKQMNPLINSVVVRFRGHGGRKCVCNSSQINVLLI